MCFFYLLRRQEKKWNMENSPRVAVMMPVYNGEKTLRLVIKSLINQSYKNWVCYILNDGSTDGTKQILETLHDPRFVIIHFEQNKGRAQARQAILNKAEGKYLAICDADDFYHPERIKLQVAYLEAHPEVHLVSCGVASYKTIYEGILRVRGNIDLKPKEFRIGDRTRFFHAGSMYRLADAKEISYTANMRYAEDLDYLERYLHGKKYALMPDVLHYYSEFESVTKNKKIKTYLYDLNRLKNSSRPYLVKVRAMKDTLLKLIINVILYPFVSSQFYLNRLGQHPSKQNMDEFRMVVSSLIETR